MLLFVSGAEISLSFREYPSLIAKNALIYNPVSISLPIKIYARKSLKRWKELGISSVRYDDDDDDDDDDDNYIYSR